MTASRATADRLDLIVGDAAALTRGAANLVRHGQTTAPGLVAAVDDLAGAFGHVGSHLDERANPTTSSHSRLRAAQRATSSLTTTATLASCVLVGQVRTTSIDLLVITGLSQPDAVKRVEDEAGTAASLRFRRILDAEPGEAPPTG